METHSNSYNQGHFSDYNQAQEVLVHDGLFDDDIAKGWSSDGRLFDDGIAKDGSSDDGGLFDGNIAKSWNSDEFGYDGGLQPILIFGSQNGIAQSSFTGFTSSQSSSHNTFDSAGNDHSNSALVPHSVAGVQNWLPNSESTIAYPNFCQEISNGKEMAGPPRIMAFEPSCNSGPSPTIYPSSTTFQQPCNEHDASQNFKSLDGEGRRDPIFSNSLYVQPTL
jgi:hypothetical protein